MNNKAKVSPKIDPSLNKNTVEIEKISLAHPELSVSVSKAKSVLETPDTIQKKKSLVWKEPVVLSDKDLTNINVESIRNVKRSAVILSDDSSSSRNISTKEYLLKRQDSDKTPIKGINISKQKECHNIKVLPNVSNSFKLLSEKNTFDASEKVPPVSTKIRQDSDKTPIRVIDVSKQKECQDIKVLPNVSNSLKLISEKNTFDASKKVPPVSTKIRQDSDKTPIRVIDISKQKECQDIKVLPNVSNSLKLISEKNTFDASKKVPPVSTKIRQDSDKTPIRVIDISKQKECQDIKVLPNVSNSLKLISKKNTFDAAEKVPPVSTKIRQDSDKTPIRVIDISKQKECQDIKVLPNVSNSLKLTSEKNMFDASEKVPPVSTKIRHDSDKTPIKVINISKQKECQDIKVLPNVSNSLKLISEKNTFDASEKVPPVSTKIIYVGNASQIPVIKQAIATSKCALNNSPEQILQNASKVNEDHTSQMKHFSIKKVSNGKQSVQNNRTEVSGTEKIINLSESKCVLGTEAKRNLMNFLASSSIQNKQSINIEGNKQMIVLPIKSISEVSSHNLQLPSFQNSGIELRATQCNIGKNVSLNSSSPLKIYSPKQISTLNRAVNTQPFQLIKIGSSMCSSVNKPTSEGSKSFLPCSMSSLKKDVTCSSTKETENECPAVNSSVVHMESKSCLIYPLKKNPANGIKSNVIKTNNSNSSMQITSPATNVTSSVNQKRKCNLCETENKSSVPKSYSSIKKKSLMPIEVSSTKKDKDNSCKQRNKKSAIEIVSCAAEASVSNTTICPSNMNEIGFDKNNRYKTWSKNIHQPTQQKNQFVLTNKVGNFVSLPKFTPEILLPKVVLKKLPDAVTEACMKKGYIILRKLPQISVSSTIEDTEFGEEKNKALKRKLVECSVSTNLKVQVRSTKCDELNDNKGVSHTKAHGPIHSALPTLKKGVWPTNLKIIKISANELGKLNCFKNLRATVPPSASKQQTLPIPILVNKDAEKKKTETKNETKMHETHKSASMHHKTPMKQVFVKKENRKSLSYLLNIIESDKQRKVEKDKMKKKEKILKKMLLKYEEKEEKKRWKYLQKRLIRCIEKNKNLLKRRTGILMEIVTNSSKLKEHIQNLNCTENDDVRHLLFKLVKTIRKDSIVAISKSHKEVTKSQSVQGEKTVNKDQVPSFVNMSACKIQRNHKSHAKVGKRKKSISKSTSINIFSSSASQDNIYRYDPESERSRADIISYSKLNESQAKVSPKKDASYKLRRQNPKKLHTDDPFVDLSIITDEKFTVECACESRDCDGIHPEFL